MGTLCSSTLSQVGSATWAKPTDGRTDGQMDRRTGGRTDRRTGGRADEQTDGGTGGRTDGRAAGKASRRPRTPQDAPGDTPWTPQSTPQVAVGDASGRPRPHPDTPWTPRGCLRTLLGTPQDALGRPRPPPERLRTSLYVFYKLLWAPAARCTYFTSFGGRAPAERVEHVSVD